MNFFFQLLFNGILTGALYSMISSGFSLIYTTNKIINFSHGAMIVLGAYMMYLFYAISDSILFSSILSIVSLVAIGYISSKIVWRLKDNSKTTMIIITVAILIIVENLIQIIFGAGRRSFSIRTESFDIFSIIFTHLDILIIIIGLIIASALFLIVYTSKLGLLIRCVSDNEKLAEIIGISTEKIRTISFVIASIIAGIAGILIGFEYNIEPTMGTQLMIKGFTAAIVGGLSSIRGSVAGGFLLGIVENIGIGFLPTYMEDAIAYSILLLFLYIKPRGLFGR